MGDANGTPYPAGTAGPSSPTPPADAARPASWPGGPQDPASNPRVPPGAVPPVDAAGVAPGSADTAAPRKDPTEPPYEPAAILARVGTEVVQAAEILPTVHQTLDAYMVKVADELSQMPPEFQAEQRKKWHREVVQKTLDDAIKVKLLLTEIKGVVPEEQLKKNNERIRKEFNENEIKRLMGLYKVASIAELENKLREQGGSLDTQRSLFVDRYMAISWLRMQVKDQKEPTHEEMASYYRDHTMEWERPARARWEQLTARFDAFPNKEAAWRALATSGNDAQRGIPGEQVAKARSTAFSAEDWTTKGSLRSTTLDAALFALPVGALSQIIEDEDGFHIVRVVEREEQHHVPFGEVQAEIKQRLLDKDQAKGMNVYLATLRERTPVTDLLNGDNSTIAARPTAPPR